MLAVFWTECAVALIVVCARLYSRLMIKNLGIDDWIMFFTMVRILHNTSILPLIMIDRFASSCLW